MTGEGGYAGRASLVGDLYVAVDFKDSKYSPLRFPFPFREREALVGIRILYLTFNCLSFCLSFNFVEGVGGLSTNSATEVRRKDRPGLQELRRRPIARAMGVT